MDNLLRQKNPGHCWDVAISGGLTAATIVVYIIYYFSSIVFILYLDELTE